MMNLKTKGEKIYNTSCVSCHGTPSLGNYTPLAPPPGDVANDVFKEQTDGALFYKIQQGRGIMPGFGNALGDEEIWQLVAFIRGFHEGYTQPAPNLEGIEIPTIKLVLDFDDNVDKLVVKVSDDQFLPVEEATVTAFIKGMFGNLLLGKVKTNKLGIAYFDVDTKIPGDEKGHIEVLVKAKKGYGTSQIEEQIALATPTKIISATAGRHLWSKAKHAPIWLIIVFNLVFVSTWCTIVYVLLGLRKLSKLK